MPPLRFPQARLKGQTPPTLTSTQRRRGWRRETPLSEKYYRAIKFSLS